MFQWGGLFFRDGGGASFLSGGVPHGGGGIGFGVCMGVCVCVGGGGASKKIVRGGRVPCPPCPPPHYGKPCPMGSL